ncbi:MAG: AAA family ATPase [Patescibacteria group bacterium]
MFKFLPEESPIFKATKAPLLIRKASLIKNIFFYLFFGSLVFWVLMTFESSLRIISTTKLLGLLSLSFFSYFLFWYLNLFFETELKNPTTPMPLPEANGQIDKIDFAKYFDYYGAKYISKALKSKSKDSTELLYHLLKDADFVHFVFARLLIDERDLIKAVKSVREKNKRSVISDCLKNTITRSLSIAAKRNHERIRAEDLLVALAHTNEYFEQVLIRGDIKEREIRSLTSWWIRMKKAREKRKKIWKYENLVKMGTIGRQWASGSAYLLNKFATDWTEVLSKRGFREIVGHKKAMNSLERIMSGDGKNNVMIVGEPGTGRRAVIDELTRRSFLGLSLTGVNYKRVYKLELQSIIAQVEGKENTERMLDRIFNEIASAGNIILVIDNIQEFVSGEHKAGVVDISGVLEPYLKYSNFKVVGITNYKDYRRIIERNQAINSGFKKVELSEISTEDSLELCEMITPNLENKYDIFISYQALQATVELSEKFLTSDPFPEKAMQLLEEAIIFADQKKKKVLKKEDVAEVVSEKAEVPVGEAADDEKKALLNLEEEVHKRIINQEKAVSDIAKSLRRSRANIDTRTGLIGSFLFLGPTGVGKTETAKAIADIYFGSVDRMIRIDMSEYQNISDLSRLIGSENREGVLTEQVVEDPFSLILLDELEKAHKDILNLFLQILDEGHVTDGVGRKVDFRNCMIIATSNAGYKIIMDSVRKEIPLEKVKQDILDYLFREGLFRPEFVNRFDGTVIFEPLSKDNLIDIAELQLQKLKNNLKEKHIDLQITEELKKKIVEISYEPVFGAREMQRVIQNKVGDALASGMLSDELEAGDKVKINPEDFSVEKIN